MTNFSSNMSDFRAFGVKNFCPTTRGARSVLFGAEYVRPSHLYDKANRTWLPRLERFLDPFELAAVCALFENFSTLIFFPHTQTFSLFLAVLRPNSL